MIDYGDFLEKFKQSHARGTLPYFGKVHTLKNVAPDAVNSYIIV